MKIWIYRKRQKAKGKSETGFITSILKALLIDISDIISINHKYYYYAV
jgi:hypothetical protein